MGQYILRRLLLFVPTLILVSLIVFFVMRIVPGDPALIILSGTTGDGEFTPEQLEAKRVDLGTNRHIMVQYWQWASGILTGDLGDSYWHQGITANAEIKRTFPVTLQLAFMAIVMASVLAIPIGVMGAVEIDSPND